MSRPITLFVYGTLRPGSFHPRSRWLASQARLIGTGGSRGVLYDFGRYPGAMFGPEHRHLVTGDLFVVKLDSPLLRALDAYEFGPADAQGALYHRVEIEVRLAGGTRLPAMAYALKRPPLRPKRIRNGDWTLHLRSRAGRPVRT